MVFINRCVLVIFPVIDAHDLFSSKDSKPRRSLAVTSVISVTSDY